MLIESALEKIDEVRTYNLSYPSNSQLLLAFQEGLLDGLDSHFSDMQLADLVPGLALTCMITAFWEYSSSTTESGTAFRSFLLKC